MILTPALRALIAQKVREIRLQMEMEERAKAEIIVISDEEEEEEEIKEIIIISDDDDDDWVPNLNVPI